MSTDIPNTITCNYPLAAMYAVARGIRKAQTLLEAAQKGFSYLHTLPTPDSIGKVQEAITQLQSSADTLGHVMGEAERQYQQLKLKLEQ